MVSCTVGSFVRNETTRLIPAIDSPQRKWRCGFCGLWVHKEKEREREVIKQRRYYACNCNERSICHISHKIISSAALSKYLTGANKWKIIAECPGTPNFIHLFYLRAFRCFNGSSEEAINLLQLSRSFISVCVVATLQLINPLFGTPGCYDMRLHPVLF